MVPPAVVVPPANVNGTSKPNAAPDGWHVSQRNWRTWTSCTSAPAHVGVPTSACVARVVAVDAARRASCRLQDARSARASNGSAARGQRERIVVLSGAGAIEFEL